MARIITPTYFCIIDFESTTTCSNKHSSDSKKQWVKEITAISSILCKYTNNTIKELSRFHKFCKPLQVNDCEIDYADRFPVVFYQYNKWINEYTDATMLRNDIIFVTYESCTHSANKTLLLAECNRWNIYTPHLYSKYININTIVLNNLHIDANSLQSIMMNLGLILIFVKDIHQNGISNCTNMKNIFNELMHRCGLNYRDLIETMV